MGAERKRPGALRKQYSARQHCLDIVGTKQPLHVGTVHKQARRFDQLLPYLGTFCGGRGSFCVTKVIKQI